MKQEHTTPRDRREIERDMALHQAECAIDEIIRLFGRDFAREFFNERLETRS